MDWQIFLPFFFLNLKGQSNGSFIHLLRSVLLSSFIFFLNITFFNLHYFFPPNNLIRLTWFDTTYKEHNSKSTKMVQWWAVSPTSHSYGPTSFPSSDHCVVLWVECTCLESGSGIQMTVMSVMCLIWLHLTFSHHQWASAITSFEGFVQNLLPLLFFLDFLHGILLVTFWLAEAAKNFGSLEPYINEKEQ